MGLILLWGVLALLGLALALGVWVGKAWPCERCGQARGL